MNRLQRWAGAALMLPLAFAACDTTEDVIGIEDGTRVSLYVTDAPGDVEAVWMEFLGATMVGEAEDVDLLTESSGLIKVTDLVGGIAEELGDDIEVAGGSYSTLRLWLGDVIIQTTDGKVYTMGDPELPEGLDEPSGEIMCPSCSQSGLKIQLHGMDLEEGDHALVFDADISQSFGHPAGNSGKWVMHPVIHATFLEDGDDNLEGEGNAITGTVVLDTGVEIPATCGDGSPDLTAFVPTATAHTLQDEALNPIVKSGATAGDGAFSINFVEDDTYTMGYVAQVEYTGGTLNFTATSPSDAVVAGADVSGLQYTITAAECVTP